MRAACPLATIFAARAGGMADASLEARLVGACARARASAAPVEIEDATFVAYLAERGGVAVESAHLDDLYLACACANGARGAIAALEAKQLAPLTALLRRTSAARDVADEAVQRLRERLFVAVDARPARIHEYSGRGPLGAWLRVAAIRIASNLRRDEDHLASRSRALVDDGTLLPLAGDAELGTIARRYGAAFNGALRDAFASLTTDERNVLRLHFVDGLNLDRIGAILALSRATIGRRMITARERLLHETMGLLGERLNATPTELQSLLGVLRSNLDVSLAELARFDDGAA